MKELATAIKARYDAAAGAALRALVKGLWPYEAPQGTVPPYITYSSPALGTDLVMPLATHDIVNTTFSIWSNSDSPLEAETIRDALIALFDNQILTLSTKNVVYANRVGGNTVRDPDSGWACHVQYEYRIG